MLGSLSSTDVYAARVERLEDATMKFHAPLRHKVVSESLLKKLRHWLS
jgi:hypothetical protein